MREGSEGSESHCSYVLRRRAYGATIFYTPHYKCCRPPTLSPDPRPTEQAWVLLKSQVTEDYPDFPDCRCYEGPVGRGFAPLLGANTRGAV